MGNSEKKLKTIKTNETFDTWISKPFISPELKKELENTNILFVPEEINLGEIDKLTFHTEMRPFYEFLKTKDDENIKAGVCIEESDYKELMLHSDIMRLGEIIVENIILPLLINYIWDFLKDRHETKIQTKLTINKQNQNNVQLDFEGTTED
ncbi:hypothetical protein LJC03_06220, partial [Methanobrevibacter sp. OttesenSCG-928-I08]|nr:hypothetical protein [Methanobrevibacter sp. OttesenSCG-928-I08]